MKSDEFTIDDAISIVKKLPIHHFSERHNYQGLPHHYYDYRSGDYHKGEDDLVVCALWVDEPDFSKKQPWVETKRRYKLHMDIFFSRYPLIRNNFAFEGKEVESLIKEYLEPKFSQRGSLEALLRNIGASEEIISKMMLEKEKCEVIKDTQKIPLADEDESYVPLSIPCPHMSEDD